MTIGLAARLLLTCVFAVAGAAKLADRAGTRDAVVQFGAPERVAGPLALLLPLAELAVAVLLLPSTTAMVAAAGALGLIAVFSAAVGTSLARGQAPDCHCFGQLHSAPASWKTLVRNLGLAAAAAGVLAAGPRPSAVAWISRLHGSQLLAFLVAVAAIAVVGAGGAALVSLLRSYGRVLIRLDRIEAALAANGLGSLVEEADAPQLGLPPGTPAPNLAVRDLHGAKVSLDDLLAPGLPLLLLFTSPRCGPCKALLPSIARWQSEHAAAMSLVVASDGTRDEVRVDAEEFELHHVLLDDDRRLYRDYQASGTPSAVLISPDRSIASWVAPGLEWIERLVSDALAANVDRGLPVGAPAPALSLPVLDGRPLDTARLGGRETLLLFWSPDCGFCRAMHERLLAWERSANGSRRLVVVSSGNADAIRAEGFRSTVVVDEQFTFADAFGAHGTPTAVLLDAQGRVAAPIASGEEEFFALAG